MTNKEIYTKYEVQWGQRENAELLPREKYLIEKYIKDKNKVIEAGCGSGRISNRISEMFDVEIDAFDYVEQFITNAKKVRQNKVAYFVADATDLNMINDNTYDCTVYLQQVICFIPKDRIQNALSEAYRILKPGGCMVMSVLNFDGRYINKPLSNILGILRYFRKQKLTYQELPWLRTEGKPNYSLLNKNQATVYWFKKDEIKNQLKQTGFKIDEEIVNDDSGKVSSIMYIVCHK
jgi:ubiquinone/menaquinone biosynthesis C-methylase UbiE